MTSKCNHRRQSGFTLLEVLVVLVIIGIITSYAALSLVSRENKVEEEALRFAQLLKLAQEQAILTTTEYAVRFEPDSYLFLRLVQGKWMNMEDDDVLRPRRLPEEIDVGLALEGESLEIKKSLKDEDALDRQPPSLYLLSSGEFSPFSVTFRNRYARTAMTVQGTLLDGVKVLVVETES